MPRISKANPSGFVYCLRAEMGPKKPPYFTKIGCSSVAYDNPEGRSKIANHWVAALGLGKIEYFQVPHQNALELEKQVKRGLRPSPNCGKSTEAFDISFEEARDRIKELASTI